ncbi:MAG: hypothetical protein LBU83_03160, partial [Bacteroidales bacterium]|nr:hypothetical protein [Bacteroidales bacterium]
MRRFVFFLIILAAASGSITAQNRAQARGAELGELYTNDPWYAIYDPSGSYYDILRMAIYHLTENGKKLSIQYDEDYFANPETTMVQGYVLADATPGVLYVRCYYSKDSYPHTALWVSFDYGKNWTWREENMGNLLYFSANFEGLIYRGGGGVFKSTDYGATFFNVEGGVGLQSEFGWKEEEIFAIGTYNGYDGILYHTYDLFKNYIEIPIDGQYVFGQMSQGFPDVYRGGLPGEVYISSWFPDNTFKVSFSADTGYAFRHVYISEVYHPGETPFYPQFMSDREAGDFYIIQRYYVEDTNPWGWHVKLCIDYYRDYGEILEASFCHDLTKNYEYEEIICDHTTDLSS